MTANSLIAVFAVFGGLLFMMTVIQLMLTNYAPKDTKNIYFTFVGVLIFILIGVLSFMCGLR